MTPTLVDIIQDVTNKVRILNPLNKKATISQDTIIGEAEKLINEHKILIEFEDTTEINNFDQVRRLKVQQRATLFNGKLILELLGIFQRKEQQMERKVE